MVLLLLAAELAADHIGAGAALQAEGAGPAAGAVVGGEGEVLAAREVRDRVAQLAVDELANIQRLEQTEVGPNGPRKSRSEKSWQSARAKNLASFTRAAAGSHPDA